MRRIGAAADRMRRLLDELLELSTVGKQVRPPEEASLVELADEALENLVSQVAEKQAEVTVDPELPMIVGDRVRLSQLVQNLLANAVKYMGDQRAPRVDFGLRHDRLGETVLFVRDNGAGIDQRYHQKVFGLFERLDAGNEGTGVGLALAKRIVEMHGGRIWIESAGLGSSTMIRGRGFGTDPGPAPPSQGWTRYAHPPLDSSLRSSLEALYATRSGGSECLVWGALQGASSYAELGIRADSPGFQPRERAPQSSPPCCAQPLSVWRRTSADPCRPHRWARGDRCRTCLSRSCARVSGR